MRNLTNKIEKVKFDPMKRGESGEKRAFGDEKGQKTGVFPGDGVTQIRENALQTAC
jgi:hypothetical protein